MPAIGYIYRPGVYSPKFSDFKELPRPIHSFKISDTVDKVTDKVPLNNGQFSTGFSLNGTTVSLSGGLGKRDGAIHFTQEEMWLLYKEVRQRTLLAAGEAQFEFFMFYDPAPASKYQKFKGGCGSQLELEMGDDDWTLFKYDLVMFFDDPTVYNTAPGA